MAEIWREVAERVRNWGKWGDSDQVGTLNYITPEKVIAASRLVKKGRSFPLCAPFDADGPWNGSFFRRNPIRTMIMHGGDEDIADHLDGLGGTVGAAFKAMYQGPMRFADDVIVMNLQSGTQWDALSHVWYESKMYNGFPAVRGDRAGSDAQRNREGGRERPGASRAEYCLTSRAATTLKHLAPNTIITPDELEATAKAARNQSSNKATW